MTIKAWQTRAWLASLGAFTILTAMIGCGGGPTLSSVTGKVTYKGQPVKGGRLVFSPVASGKDTTPGKAAMAEIKEDGTYVLGTFSQSDGAQVGKHHINFTPPEQVLTESQRKDPKYIAPPPPYMNLIAKQAEVEVKSGTNSIDIELTKK
jgi:hypothetical protein